MSNPLVSVIIPAYNCAKVILNAIDSALTQGVSLEVIVVDDCSSDDLRSALESYIQSNSVVYVKNESNLGAAGSRNRGVSMALGEYIAFLDADDIWAEGKLIKQLRMLESTGCVMCATARELINENGESTGKIIPVKSTITYRELLKHNSINCSSVLIRADVAKEFPMHNDDCHEDYIMWLEVLGKYKQACGINEPLLKYRVSNKGKSGSKLKSAKMTFKVYRYMGFGVFKSLRCFISYTFHGVKKHFFSGRNK